MKQIKWLALATFITILIFGCTKNNNDPLLTTPPTISEVTVQKGVVTFPTIQSYLTVTENKNGEQATLSTQLAKQNFIALKVTPAASNGNTSTPSAMPTISTTAFNPNLYSTYLLSVLNADKILSLNGYYVKVDMDNVFCSFIDTALPNAYNELKNNVFSNINVMTFLNPDEPVVEVLEQMRNGQLTWASYQDQLARKGGQGICFKRGIAEMEDKKTDYTSQYEIQTKVGYYRGFISFSLNATTNAYWRNSFVKHSMVGTFEWEGVCKNSGSGTYKVDRNSYLTYNNDGGSSVVELSYVAYQGGSALKKAKMNARTTAYKEGEQPGVGSLRSVGY
jgi:hypothetical protein